MQIVGNKSAYYVNVISTISPGLAQWCFEDGAKWMKPWKFLGIDINNKASLLKLSVHLVQFSKG